MYSIFDSNFIVIIFVLAIILMTYQPGSHIKTGYLIGVVLLITAVYHSPKVFEHLQVSSEAIQNVGSIYNNNKMIIKDLEVTGNLKVTGTTNLGAPLNIGSWTIKDAGEIQFVKNGGGYAVFQTDGNMWTKPTGSYRDHVNRINGLEAWKNVMVNGQGHKRNGDKGYGWNNKNCQLSTTTGGCTDLCPAGYYMSGISAGKDWDHKHPICTKFT